MTSDWKQTTLPDGRKVEWVDGRWAAGRPDDPPNTLPITVTVSIDGVLDTVRILMTDEEALTAFKAGEVADDGE